MDINIKSKRNPHGPVVAGYEVGPVMGVGTYGEVRCCRDVVSNKRVAVKIIDLTRFSEESLTLLDREIRIMKLLDHKNCVKLLQVKENVAYCGRWCSHCACSEYKPVFGSTDCLNCGAHPGHSHSGPEVRKVLFLVQELATAGELFGMVMHTGPFPEELARYYFRQLLDGLEHVHSRGIAHRDLKPENLVFDEKLDLKIVDFGLASHMMDESAVMHSGVGSQPYSAPEVYYCKELYGSMGYRGPPADIWSAAVVLFVMLTGRPPFVRPLDRTYGPNLKRCKHFMNMLRGHGYGDMSTAAQTFLMKIFQPHPDDRPSIAELRKEEWLNGPVIHPDSLSKVMEEKGRNVWEALNRPFMADLFTRLRKEQGRVSAEERLENAPFSDADIDSSLLSLQDAEQEPIHRGFGLSPVSVRSPFSPETEKCLRKLAPVSLVHAKPSDHLHNHHHNHHHTTPSASSKRLKFDFPSFPFSHGSLVVEYENSKKSLSSALSSPSDSFSDFV